MSLKQSQTAKRKHKAKSREKSGLSYDCGRWKWSSWRCVYTKNVCVCVFNQLRLENWELREWQTIFYLLFGLQSLILDLFVFVLFCSKSPAIIAIRNRITNTHNCQYKSQIQMRVHLLLLVCTAKCLKNTQLMVLQIYECNRKNAR